MAQISGETNSRADGSTIRSNMEMTAAGGVDVEFEPTTGSSGTGGAGSTMDQAKDRAQEVAGQAQDRLGEVRERAGTMASDARERATEMLDQASTRLEDSGALDMVRQNALPALGVAFGIGFLLAGSSDTGGRLGKAKHQMKGAVMGSLSAALTQQVKEMMASQGGAQGIMNSIMGNQQGGGSGQGSSSAP